MIFTIWLWSGFGRKKASFQKDPTSDHRRKYLWIYYEPCFNEDSECIRKVYVTNRKKIIGFQIRKLRIWVSRENPKWRHLLWNKIQNPD